MEGHVLYQCNPALIHFAVLLGGQWNGTDVTVSDVNGNTVLYWAYKKGDSAYIEVLL